MKFIKLTKIYSTDDFADIYLNVEEIESFQKEKNRSLHATVHKGWQRF